MLHSGALAHVKVVTAVTLCYTNPQVGQPLRNLLVITATFCIINNDGGIAINVPDIISIGRVFATPHMGEL